MAVAPFQGPDSNTIGVSEAAGCIDNWLLNSCLARKWSDAQKQQDRLFYWIISVSLLSSLIQFASGKMESWLTSGGSELCHKRTSESGSSIFWCKTQDKTNAFYICRYARFAMQSAWIKEKNNKLQIMKNQHVQRKVVAFEQPVRPQCSTHAKCMNFTRS